MNIIGFGGSGHDWSVCILNDHNILVALDEERVSRKKYGIGSNLLESQSREKGLQAANLSPSEIDVAVACDLVPLPLAAPFRRKLHRIRHHLAHAYSAFWCSPYSQSAVLVADNSGSPLDTPIDAKLNERKVETLTYWNVKNYQMELVGEVLGTHKLTVNTTSDYYKAGQTENSIGALYRLISSIIGFTYQVPGFDVISEDGKTMGLASYGKLTYLKELEDYLELCEDGQFRFRISMSDLEILLYALLNKGSSDESLVFQRRADLARAGQELLERTLLHCSKHLKKVTKQKYLAMAGGVMLNCNSNTRIAREAGFDDVFVFPAAGDNGTSVGSAIYGLLDIAGARRDISFYHQLPFLGISYSKENLETAYSIAQKNNFVPISDHPIEYAANQLANGKIVAWFEGRSEFGPRALGHRSILADPRHEVMKDHLNNTIKHREAFRPFAPIVMEEYLDEYFDVPKSSSLPFMLMIGKIKPQFEAQLLAVRHVDGTARVQSVDSDRYPTMHHLLSLFKERTGLPVLLNTSFNSAGEPIVESPLDALMCFAETKIDVLYLDGKIYSKI